MARFHVIKNVATGETREVPFTAQEESAADAAEQAAAALPRPVEKLALLERVVAAGKFEALMAALGGPGALLYERFQAAQYIASDDPDALALCAALELDPAVILA